MISLSKKLTSSFITSELLFLRKITPFLITFIVCSIGYTAVFVSSYYRGQKLLNDSIHESVSKLDDLLTTTQNVAVGTALSLDTDCETNILAFKEITALNTSIRDIYLIKNDKLYCSTNNRPHTTEILKLHHQLKPTTNALTFTVYNNSIATYYKRQHNKGSILVSLKPKTIKEALTPIVSTQQISLIFNHKPLALSADSKDIKHTYRKISLDSFNQYPYTVTTSFVHPINIRVLLYYHGIPLAIITIIAIALFFATRWFISSISSAYFELISAIQHNEIKPYAQPIYNGNTNQLTGIEILARWHHPELGIIFPDTFIPLAEKSGLIIELTRKLMKQVNEILRPYANQIAPNFHIGINISPTHCQDIELVNDCKNFMATLGKNIVLVIEITERELVESNEITKEIFKQLHELSIKIALDDFGIGNSNLAYLQDFEIDYLKIDRSFTARIGSDSLSKNVLDSIIEIAHNCKLESCAEGVETKEQADYLREKRVTFLQGYLYGKPIKLTELVQHESFQELLNNNKKS